MKNLIILLPLIIFSFVLSAQNKNSSELVPLIRKDVKPIICYSRPEVMNTKVSLPDYIKQKLNSTNQRQAATSNFEVTYVGFTPEAQTAFQYAVDIWASLLTSDIPIKIYVEYKRMDLGVLASTGWGSLNANFKNVQRHNTWYVGAMAEKIAGEELNDPEDYEMVMSFNNTVDWYQGIDQATPSDQYDMVSVVLHEIGHGLGYFSHTFVNSEHIGSYTIGSTDFPIIFDQLIENSSKENIVNTYDNNSAPLANQLTSNNVFFRSFSFDDVSLPQLYAPDSWNSGSSIAHLDEDRYGAGNLNSLMSPQLGRAESIHDPGLSLDMFNDMGWISMNIIHQRLSDTETINDPFQVSAIIKGDNGVDPSDITLHYSYDNWSTQASVSMSATGNLDEYAAVIPSVGSETKVNYYLAVIDSETRKYTSPGEATEYSHSFIAAKDTIAPNLLHTPLAAIFTHDFNARILVEVRENIGVGDLNLTYRVNGGAESSFIVPLLSYSSDGSFIGNYDYIWDLNPLGLVKGDILEYRLDIADVAANSNSTSSPGVGFNIISIDALNAVSVQYSNDFDATTDDFVGHGFAIELQEGFTTNSIQSDHPYRVGVGVSPSDTVILSYLLKTPIKLNSKGASLEFDEVVLIEPGEGGTKYGDSQFWDYAIVEGSTDFGVTWKPFADGYDSRDNSDWLDVYNSDIVENPEGGSDSNAKGDESLYRHRIINLLENENFISGNEVLIRFKLYADQLAVGWGWAIDNIKIQIDDTPPEIAHIAPDYLNIGDTQVTLTAKVTDNVEVGVVKFNVDIDGVVSTYTFSGPGEDYEVSVDFATPVSASTIFKYSIYAEDVDSNANSTTLPSSGSFDVPVVVMEAPVTMYVNDFNSASDDFIGSNFIVNLEPGFDNAAINSLHPYSNSARSVDTMSYLLKYPIILNSGHSWIKYNEVALMDYNSDYVVIQGSKDNGQSWINIVDEYNASKTDLWLDEYVAGLSPDQNSSTLGNKTLIVPNLIDVLLNENFKANDEVWIRFSMRVDSVRYGWGWMIDDLEIQGATTGIEDNLFTELSLYPNPVNSELQLVGNTSTSSDGILISINDQLGRNIKILEIQPSSNRVINESINVSSFKKGIYIIHLTDGKSSTSLKFVKQ